ncbi:DUF6119 family protein [uncultured Enterococcus sp.]|uniref:DUF6119 family protein n=1 Tax=uncultured Enterococcus sp. TaxID=167972 RepID=UPI0028E5D731|nr:DUF6119 family protein [uncultured Enterococcus sp.]
MEQESIKLTANIYKTHQDFSKEEIVTVLERKGMEQKQEFSENSTKYTLFLDSEKSSKSDWLEAINIFFDSTISQEVGELIKALILVETMKNTYIASYGYSKRYFEEVIDVEFGLDFASRAIKDYQIDAKNVDYIQRNTLRSNINYKRDRFELPQVNEAFFGIIGKPEHVFYGNKINCKESVSFSRKFGIKTEFKKLFLEIDETLEQTELISIPRLKIMSRKDKVVNELNSILLKMIRTSSIVEQNFFDNPILENDFSFNVPYIHNIDGRITEFDSSFKYRIRKKDESGKYIHKTVDYFDTETIQEYIQDNEDVTDLSDVQVIISDDKQYSKKMNQLILAELEYEGDIYLLQNGYWGKLNKNFLDVLNDQIKIIDSHKERFNNDFIIFSQDPSNQYNIYNSDYSSDVQRKYSGENGYIETIVRNNTPRVIKLHTRLVTGKGVKNELADFYDSELKELFAVKMGTTAGDCVYSFEQSIASIYLLNNKDLFEVKEKLSEYNEYKEKDGKDINRYHQILPEEIIDDILSTKITNVLWVVPESKNKTVNNQIHDKTFTINSIKSFMVKLKLIEWYNVCIQNGYTPQLVMVGSNAILEKLPRIPTSSYFKVQQHENIYYE